MTTVLFIWAILGPSIGLLAGSLLTAGVLRDSHSHGSSTMGPRVERKGYRHG